MRMRTSDSRLNTARGLGIVLIIHSILILLVGVATIAVMFQEAMDSFVDNPLVPSLKEQYVVGVLTAMTGLIAPAMIMGVKTMAAGAAGAGLCNTKSASQNYAYKASMEGNLAGNFLACIFYMAIVGFVTFYEYEFFVENAATDLLQTFGALLTVQFGIAGLTLLVTIIALGVVVSYQPGDKDMQEMMPVQTLQPAQPTASMVPTYAHANMGYSYPTYVSGMYR